MFQKERKVKYNSEKPSLKLEKKVGKRYLGGVKEIYEPVGGRSPASLGRRRRRRTKRYQDCVGVLEKTVKSFGCWDAASQGMLDGCDFLKPQT